MVFPLIFPANLFTESRITYVSLHFWPSCLHCA
jgi:hypothetical protein